MAQTYLKGSVPTVHRIDLPCEQTGFHCPPPSDGSTEAIFFTLASMLVRPGA